jgi:hypothetical protein
MNKTILKGDQLFSLRLEVQVNTTLGRVTFRGELASINCASGSLELRNVEITDTHSGSFEDHHQSYKELVIERKDILQVTLLSEKESASLPEKRAEPKPRGERKGPQPVVADYKGGGLGFFDNFSK